MAGRDQKRPGEVIPEPSRWGESCSWTLSRGLLPGNAVGLDVALWDAQREQDLSLCGCFGLQVRV